MFIYISSSDIDTVSFYWQPFVLMQSVVQSIIRLRCVIMGLLVVMWGMESSLVKVGGVDTEMYRTGHSCLLHKPRRILPLQLSWCAVLRSVWGDHVKSDKGLLNTQQGETPGMVSLVLSAWSVRTDQWRLRSFTMSCLDVMYPAYGHYAPYAPTAPAFINSLQVWIVQTCSLYGLLFSALAGSSRIFYLKLLSEA